MKTEKLAQLAQVTEALYLREYEKIRPILAREAELRRDLTRLNGLAEEARRQEADAFAMRTVGADLLWQGWVTRTRRQLNIELATVMARKIEAMRRVRKAFGRRQAVAATAGTAADQRRDAARKRFEAALLERDCEGSGPE
jgi:hypothetical protein